VAITEKSRRPSRLIAKVLRDGCGGEREDIDLGAQALQGLLLAHAEAVLLVDDDQAEVLEADVPLHQAVGADDEVDAAVGEPLRATACSFGVRKRDSSAMRTGHSARRSEKFWKCCSASSVVGTRTATW
jgi:hypothetical protein